VYGDQVLLAHATQNLIVSHVHVGCFFIYKVSYFDNPPASLKAVPVRRDYRFLGEKWGQEKD